MFRLFFGSDRGGTCRPVKNHVPGSKREMMSDITLKTLGSGDLIGIIYFLQYFMTWINILYRSSEATSW